MREELLGCRGVRREPGEPVLVECRRWGPAGAAGARGVMLLGAELGNGIMLPGVETGSGSLFSHLSASSTGPLDAFANTRLGLGLWRGWLYGGGVGVATGGGGSTDSSSLSFSGCRNGESFGGAGLSWHISASMA